MIEIFEALHLFTQVINTNYFMLNMEQLLLTRFKKKLFYFLQKLQTFLPWHKVCLNFNSYGKR